MTTRINRPTADLIAASQHLAYEVNMLAAVAQELGRVAESPGVFRNALLESFTVHARALLQFFYPTHARPNDVLSDDYFDDRRSWRQALGPQPKSLNQVSGRVATEIVHLTYRRVSVLPEARDWNITEISEAILALVDAFLAHAPKEKVAPQWAGAPTTLLYSTTLPAATNSVTLVNSPAVNAAYGGRRGDAEG